MNVILDLVQTLEVAPLDLPIPGDGRLQKIFLGLTENPADKRNLDDWGKTVGTTSRTLARLFRSKTGMSFTQWGQQVKNSGRSEKIDERRTCHHGCIGSVVR